MHDRNRMRCAIYARYSTNLQRSASIDDQIRQCREYAARNGYLVVDGYVRSDEALSGASLQGRKGLESLMEAAKEMPRPFDVVLVDDTSRVARNTADALKTVEIFKFNGVAVISVSQGIDSRQNGARQLLTLNAMMDEEYNFGVADKVHRGQEGRVLQGLVPGGRCYGYRNVPIEDPTRIAKYGRPAVTGVRAEIVEEQANVVRRIFTMCADGMSLAKMAKTLNAEGVLSPEPSRNRKERSWCTSSIREMLLNERYKGIQVWNRTKKDRNPETGRKVSRARPKSEEKRVEVPDWRIVSDELWDAAHASFKVRALRFSSTGKSGVSAAASGKYLFSGLLVCGCCGARLVIVSGRGKRGYQKYGCPNHRYRGTCTNGLMIRQDRLEEQLLSFLERNILTEEMVNFTVQLFEAELNKRLTTMADSSNEQNAGFNKLKADRDERRAEAQRIGKAIAAAGHSPTLLKMLAEVEAKVQDADRRIEVHKAPDIKTSVAEVREYVTKALLDLRSLLHTVVHKAKLKLAQHLVELVLTPRETETGRVYEVTGNWRLLPDKECVISLVARDGIEPPTPAFSGLRSTS